MSLQPLKRARIDAHPLQALSIDLWRRIFHHLEWWDRAALSQVRISRYLSNSSPCGVLWGVCVSRLVVP